jgi:hypothetical protein
MSSDLTASIQILTLNKGLYLISVKAASPRRVGDDAEMFLPAIHVGAGPGATSGQIEIMPGPRNESAWLFEAKDMLVAKVVSGPANLLLTSLRAPSMPNLEVEVQRLGAKSAPAPAQAASAVVAPALPRPSGVNGHAVVATPPPPAAVLRDAQGRTPLRTRMALHIQFKGDVAYVDNYWAGALGERLAIESFAITPLEGLMPDQIEYRAVTDQGYETDWISGGGDCGSRGQDLPLAGFAVRVKPGVMVGYDCEYRGSFSSGKIVGPVRNGAFCRGEPGDRLEAMQLFIVERAASTLGGDPPLLAQEDMTPEIPPPLARPLGPRFSVFREDPA